jgi:asparagine synthase (glutamine-hydrolysing)
MCGIVGLVAWNKGTEEARGVVTAMAERIRHRGPDGGGVIAHADATLGMTRLAIVDVEHGHQPMANEDESIVMVYNGEVYNAPELRAQLESEGVHFRTRSDTEVILRLYERNPDRVEEHLVGMWAFAIHDRKRRRVTLSRDRFGIKPFFVVDRGGAIAFASELRCFDRALAPFAEAFQIDHGAAHGMITWSFTPHDSTIYRGVHRLPPASRLQIDLDTGKRTARTYWHLVPSAAAGAIRHIDDACAELDPMLRRAVREHLESDVPIATFLSGGIDSSLISGYALEESSRPIKAFTIGFHEKEFDESPFARETAARLGVPIDVAMFDEQTAISKVADVLAAYDEPFGDSSSLATYLLSSHVAKGYKVALGGDGGDEIFAGYYGKYRVVKLRRPFQRVPRLRNGLAWAMAQPRMPDSAPSLVKELVRQGQRLARGLGGSDDFVFAELGKHASFARTAPLMRQPVDGEAFLETTRAHFREASGTELQRYLACDLENSLSNDMLVKVDRASMACHLEARVPFLDHRVVEFGVGLREELTLGTNGKRVLRVLHERRFGKELANRKKRGFGVPVQRWLTTAFDGACERLFEKSRLDRHGVLSSAELSNGGYRKWRDSDPMILWHVLALAAWCEIYLGGGKAELQQIFQEPGGAPTQGRHAS